MSGTNFQAAAFSVSELKAATTQAECLKVEEPPPHVGRARRETVNGVTFTVIETDGVATGNLIDGDCRSNSQPQRQNHREAESATFAQSTKRLLDFSEMHAKREPGKLKNYHTGVAQPAARGRMTSKTEVTDVVNRPLHSLTG